ncbi:MAG: asparagine synthase (glutamine-hydrolyzing) [Desulfocapsaceae bacterium]|nr:asparagine synthase (glutamine-hydrolyzing) [Desulfosporosinus sp.]MDR3629538.1 asparagine synthase (glutamine-hydrolyzing) [Desulfocapsaceae bacterium]
MCGITGIFQRNGQPVNPDGLIRMTRTLLHRGPDEEGYFVNASPSASLEREGIPIHFLPEPAPLAAGWVGLGHRRLSIIDLKSGQQPLSNEDGSIWIAFNGEIYNFQELAAELKGRGHQFRTNSDTETIVHAYEEYGERCVEKFRGMFAFALWDNRRQELFIARDRLGKKPLYYALEDSRFLFASEIKAILDYQDVPRTLNMQALSDYLSLLYIPAPQSIFTSVCKLPAAHYAVITATACTITQYWDLSFEPDGHRSSEQIQEGLLEILQDATRMRMISEVPLGAFLSGGVDSSAVVACMSKVSREPVKTNAIAFPYARYDESVYARDIAKRFGTDHQEFLVEPDAVSVIEKLAWHYDEPFADPSAVPTYYVSKMTRDRVTVALSGDGGDENFAGYRRYYFDCLEQRIRGLLPDSIRRSLFGTLGFLYPKADYLPQMFRAKTLLSNIARDPAEAYCFSMSAFKEEDKRRLLKPEILHALQGYRTDDLFKDLYRKAPAVDHLSKIQYIDIKTYLAEEILTKVDRASMAVSLEVRCPILDHRLMEYAAGIPSDMKLAGKDGKHIFKQALSRYLPAETLWREKMGFSMPVKEWFRRDLKDYLHACAVDGPATHKYLNRSHLESMYHQHVSGRRDWTAELWAVLMLNLWDRNYSGDSH